ncbi:MAG: hypothetical protein ACI85O_002842 [Saprospiraceae bacterium]|jgi:hypothetical protein
MNLQKCDLPKCAVEVLIIVNNGKHVSEKILERNRATYLQIMDWSKANFKPLLKFHTLFHDELPKFFASRNVALKIGMDEAVFRLEKAKSKRGIIVTLDADFRVEKNYFVELEKHFKRRKVPRICRTEFAFSLTGIDFEDKVYEAAIQYELHLRYLEKAFVFAGFKPDLNDLPTSIAVDAETYQKRGGWSSALGNSDLLQGVFVLDKTVVSPSPRVTDCQAEGTGATIKAIVKNKGVALTYHRNCFADLKAFFDKSGSLNEIILGSLQDCPMALSDYFKSIEFEDCQLNDETFLEYFEKRHLEKFLVFAHDGFYEKIDVLVALGLFFRDVGELSGRDWLLWLRG